MSPFSYYSFSASSSSCAFIGPATMNQIETTVKLLKACIPVRVGTNTVKTILNNDRYFVECRRRQGVPILFIWA